MGGEFGGEWIHVYVRLSPFAVHLKLSTLLVSYTPIQNFKIFRKRMGCGEWGEEQPFSAEKTAIGVIMKET